MNDSEIRPLAPMSAELQSAVNHLYEVFKYRKAPPGMLDVCTHCCMDAGLEREMRTLPLRSLSERHFYEYGDSAKSEVQPAPELLYLLPRLLELLAQGQYLRHSLEITLDRLGNCPRDAFNETQWQAIECYASALFAQVLSKYPWELDNNAFDYLLMFDFGGIDVGPLLALWLDADTPQATLNYVWASYFDYWYENGTYSNPFAEGQRIPFIETVSAWIENPCNRRLFALRILNLELDQQPGAAQWRCGWKREPKEVIDFIFDSITQDLNLDTQ